MDDGTLKELIDCWKADERYLPHQAEQRLITLAVAEVERLQRLVFAFTAGYYGYECRHGQPVEKPCAECDVAYAAYKNECRTQAAKAAGEE